MVREAQVGSDLLFRVLIEHSPDVIDLITSDGTIAYAKCFQDDYAARAFKTR